MHQKRHAIDLPAEIARALGSSPEAAAMARDPGLLVRALKVGGYGPGYWSPMPPYRDGAFKGHLEAILCPGEQRLIRVDYVASRGSARVVAAFELLRGVRVSSGAGKTVQVPARTKGVLVVGPPDRSEDLADVQAGLAEEKLLLLLDPARPKLGLLLAARPMPGSAWWPAAPRTGPRPSRRKPAGE
jgi:hypothetical protein